MQNSETPNTPPDLSKNIPATPPPLSPPGAPSNSPAMAPVPVSVDVIGQAWNLLQPQIGMWIVALLIYGAISGVLNGLSLGVQALGGRDPSLVFAALNFIISVVSFVVSLLVSAGLMKMAIHHVRSGQVELSKIFDIADVVVPVIIAGILVTLATALGFVLLIIPGVILALGFSMTTPLIVDQKAAAIEAITRSWEACKPHLGALFVLYLVLGLLNLAGLCACGLGLLITGPMTQLAIALTYRNLFGIGQSNPSLTPAVFPPPPIASP